MSAIDYTEMDCKLFVGRAPGVETLEELLAAVAAAVGGSVDHLEVESGAMGVMVGANDDADESADPDARDAFLSLPFLAEVYFAPDTEHGERVARVSELMTHLRSRGPRVVAASDYEDELPA